MIHESLEQFLLRKGTFSEIVSEFIDNHCLQTLSTGKYNLPCGGYVTVTEYQTSDDSRLESHRLYVDVQLLVTGCEQILVAPASSGSIIEKYNLQKDVLFASTDGKAQSIVLQPMDVAVFYPWDLHAPGITDQVPATNRKLVFKIPVSVITDTGTKRIVCCGDSITFGYMASGPDKAYPVVLQQLLGQKYTVMNCGRNGATVIDDYPLVPDRYAPYSKSPEFLQATASSPDVVILMLGMNDANPTHHFNANAGGKITDHYQSLFRDALTQLITQLRQLPSKPAVILGCTTHMCRTPGKIFSEEYVADFKHNLNVIRYIQKSVAAEMGIPFVDTLTNMDNPAFYSDGCHMTDSGYSNLAQIFLPATRKWCPTDCQTDPCKN